MRVLTCRTRWNANTSCAKHSQGKSGRVGRKLSLSYSENSASRNRTKRVLDLVQECLENEIQECKIFFRIRNLKIQKFIDIVMHNA